VYFKKNLLTRSDEGFFNRTQDNRAPLLIPFGIPTQLFFSDTRHQKRSLASLNEYFGNAEAGKKPMLGNKMELLEVPNSVFQSVRE